jgi:hypothetical protein
MLRDSRWLKLASPYRAAARWRRLGVEPAVLVIALEDLVRRHLEELASECVEF